MDGITMSNKQVYLFFLITCLTKSSLPVHADIDNQLLELNLEQLMGSEITSVSRQSQDIIKAPAAVSIISQIDIKRSGARTIPELLRMVPGLQSYQMNSHAWSVSSRGNNGVFSSKILTLIDGRSIYSPMLGSAMWDVNQLLLEDIERIEVISGPGAAMWGNNSVNGVINIITKNAKSTQGGYFEAGIGTHEKGFGGLRYGDQISNDISYRTFVTTTDYDHNETPNSSLIPAYIPAKAKDNWYARNAGFRVDLEQSPLDTVMIKGDVFKNSAYQGFTTYDGFIPNFYDSDIKKEGFNLHGRWSHTLKNNSEGILQIWHEYYNSDSVSINEKRNSFDIDFQHAFDLTRNTNLMWGLNYRNINQETKGNEIGSLVFNPDSLVIENFSAFIHSNTALYPDLFHLSFSSRFEYNDFVGATISPSIRLSYTPDTNSTFWGALSKSHRTPSIVEYTTFMSSPYFQFEPNINQKPEEIISLELGYKSIIKNDLVLNATIFNNKYSHALGIVNNGTCNAPAIPSCDKTTLENMLDGYSYGAELSLDWKIRKNWLAKIALSTVHIDMKTNLEDSIAKSSEINYETSSATNILSLLNRYDFENGWKADLWLRYNDNISSIDIDKLITMDLSLTKKFNQVEFSLVGKSLLDNQHPEYNDSLSGYIPSEVPRSVYAKISWNF